MTLDDYPINALECLNVGADDVEDGTLIPIVNLGDGSTAYPRSTWLTSAPILEETNGLGLYLDPSYEDGEHLIAYFTSFTLFATTDSLGSYTGGTGTDCPANAGCHRTSNIYRYDFVTGDLQAFPAPRRVTLTGDDANFVDNGQVRRGAVDPTTGIYYFSTTATDNTGSNGRSRHIIYAFDYRTGTSWHTATIVTGNAANGGGQSGDFDFTTSGLMVFVTGGGNTAYVYDIPWGEGAEKPRTPQRIVVSTPTASVRFESATGQTPGNGVGIAFGGDGYLYLTNNDGHLYQINPAARGADGAWPYVPLRRNNGQEVALGNSGPTVDLATIPPFYPVTVSLVKEAQPWLLDSDGDGLDDRFDLSISQNGTSLGSKRTEACPAHATPDSGCSGVIGRVEQVILLPGHGSLLMEQVARDDNDKLLGDLSKYQTALECVYVENGVVVGALEIQQPDLVSPDSRSGVITVPMDSLHRNVVCTFVNLSVLITLDSMPFTGGPLLAWAGGALALALSAPLCVTLAKRSPPRRSFGGAGPP